jgi:hypothetical protein
MPDELTPLEQNALKWVTLCQTHRTDPATTSSLDFKLDMPRITKVRVELFRSSGKFYTEETWTIPDDAIGPYDMERSPDFRRISGGHVLIPAQEPWHYPHLFLGRVE